MVVCPNCGNEVVSPTKSWPVYFKRQNEPNIGPQLCLGVFECKNCGEKFRSRVEKATLLEPATGIVGLVERVNSIRNGLSQSLNTLREKILALETERSSLMIELEELKKKAELHVTSLETEIIQLPGNPIFKRITNPKSHGNSIQLTQL